jgi:uncharacterized protein (TIGR03083 family)
MPVSSPWPIIHAERAALADDLAALTDAQWAQESLCPGWSVHDVLAHMTATAKMTPARMIARLAMSGFKFHAMSQKNIAAETASTPAATLAEFRRVQAFTSSPPGPVDTWLGETIVHSEDIRRPLGIHHTYPANALVRVAEFYKRSNLLIGAKNRGTGLTLRASDTNWSSGTGPEVSGPMLSLVLAMTGRQPAANDLTGEGAATLRSRI